MYSNIPTHHWSDEAEPLRRVADLSKSSVIYFVRNLGKELYICPAFAFIEQLLIHYACLLLIALVLCSQVIQISDHSNRLLFLFNHLNATRSSSDSNDVDASSSHAAEASLSRWHTPADARDGECPTISQHGPSRLGMSNELAAASQAIHLCCSMVLHLRSVSILINIDLEILG